MSPGWNRVISSLKSFSRVTARPFTFVTTSPPVRTSVAWKRTSFPPPLMPAFAAGPSFTTSATSGTLVHGHAQLARELRIQALGADPDVRVAGLAARRGSA